MNTIKLSDPFFNFFPQTNFERLAVCLERQKNLLHIQHMKTQKNTTKNTKKKPKKKKERNHDSVLQ